MRRKLLSVSGVCAAMLLAVAWGAGAKDQQKAELGKAAPGFTLQDQTGKSVSLSDYKGKIVVLEWVNPECPFVQRHYREKTMSTLATKYAPKDVVWLAINTTSTATDQTNEQWVKQNQLTYPILNDSQGAVGRMYGAKTTPHMFIIDQEGVLRYMGGIDNDPSGKKADRTNYVDVALGQLLAGQAVSEAQTRSYGCSVKYSD